ncbi:MAG: tetratricopeptide repeat protein [Myxococcales bacterium]|nr:tetratricopeptide repeat protein [Myxococcales bacterium]
MRPRRRNRAFVRRTLPALALALVGLATSACAQRGPSTRSLHYVDDELVYSRPAHYRSYAAYLRARLALEGQPADLEVAAEQIGKALEIEPKEPHLWTTLAEVELRRGDRQAAREASEMALQIRPNYAPAQQMLAKLEAGDDGSTPAMSSRQP